MPHILSFELSNFKGADAVRIDIADRNSAPVTTLIGLNESGKTTILEGLSYFVTGDNALSLIFEGIHSKGAVADLIPVHRKAAFTGQVKISALVKLDKADLELVGEAAKNHDLEVDQEELSKSFWISRVYGYQDSVPTRSMNTWNFTLKTRKLSKKPSKKPFEAYKRPDAKAGEAADLWLEIVSIIENGLPRIAYFPTFLVDMPARIYLAEHANETPTNRYYRLVIQDILTSIDPTLSIEKHVVQRISEFKTAQKTPLWLSVFFGAPTKSHIDSVFQKIASAVTKEVIGSWSKVFQRPSGARAVLVEWNVDAQKEDLPYCSFFVSDGESRYAVSERSLGFRWFFSFLLFTSFKKVSSRPTVFLFDEPAANLHAKAQAELLTNFGRISASGNRIIYSTHSHHMINPRWLSSAYIVENRAIDYDASDNFELNSGPTSIKATGYRQFVAEYPERTSYFQPVLEKLEYVTPEVVGSAPYLILEGITDYYALRYVKDHAERSKWPFSLMPGVGAGASGTLISYLIGRGDKFFVLLDDDAAGRKAADRYRADWFLTAREVRTVGELDPSLKGKKLESLLSEETIELVKEKFPGNSSSIKKQIGLYLAEACADPTAMNALGAETTNRLRGVLDAVGKLLEEKG